MSFIAVAGVNDIPINTARSFSVGIWQVLVANVDGQFYAINNTCPHRGWSLSQGTLKGTTITCQLDGAKFDVRTGRCVSGPKAGLFFREKKVHDVTVFEIKVEAGNIMVSSA